MFRNQLIEPSFYKEASKKDKKKKDKETSPRDEESNSDSSSSNQSQTVEPSAPMPTQQQEQMIQPSVSHVSMGSEQMVQPQQTQPILQQQPQIVQPQQQPQGMANMAPLVGGAAVGGVVGGTLGNMIFGRGQKNTQQQLANIDSQIQNLERAQLEVQQAGEIIKSPESQGMFGGKSKQYQKQYGNTAERQSTLAQLQYDKNELMNQSKQLDHNLKNPSMWGRVGRFAGVAGSIVGGMGIGAALVNKFTNQKPLPKANLNASNPYDINQQSTMSPDMNQQFYPKVASLKNRYKIASIL